MTYRGIVNNGVVVLDGDKPIDGTIVEVTPLDESALKTGGLDISARLNELRNLQDGWLEGNGKSPMPEGLDWLAGAFARRFPRSLPLPYLYPTPEGGIQAEWTVHPWEASLEIDLAGHTGEWHCLNMTTSQDDTRTLNLNSDDSWEWLAGEIGRIARGAA